MTQLLGCQTEVPVLLVDNLSAISWIKNGNFEARSKHIDIKFKFMFEKFSNKMLRVQYVKSEDQEADIFTKPLPKNRFVKLRASAGVV